MAAGISAAAAAHTGEPPYRLVSTPSLPRYAVTYILFAQRRVWRQLTTVQTAFVRGNAGDGTPRQKYHNHRHYYVTERLKPVVTFNWIRFHHQRPTETGSYIYIHTDGHNLMVEIVTDQNLITEIIIL